PRSSQLPATCTLTCGYFASHPDCRSRVVLASGFKVERSKSKKMRSPTFATKSSWLPGTGPAVVAAPVPVEAFSFLSAHAASRATAARAPIILLFMLLFPGLGLAFGRYTEAILG